MQLETSMRRVRGVVTRPEVFDRLHNDITLDEYLPNPNDYHFVVGDGLFIYSKQDGFCLELETAITSEDMPANPIKELHKQWDYLASLGWYKVYAIVCKDHARARALCRSAGMEKQSGKELNIYSKVIQ